MVNSENLCMNSDFTVSPSARKSLSRQAIKDNKLPAAPAPAPTPGGGAAAANKPKSNSGSRSNSKKPPSSSKLIEKPLRNPFLLFLRAFRKTNVGLKPKEIIIQGAQKWNSMNSSEKSPYYEKARKAQKSAHRNSPRHSPRNSPKSSPKSSPKRHTRHSSTRHHQRRRRRR